MRLFVKSEQSISRSTLPRLIKQIFQESDVFGLTDNHLKKKIPLHLLAKTVRRPGLPLYVSYSAVWKDAGWASLCGVAAFKNYNMHLQACNLDSGSLGTVQLFQDSPMSLKFSLNAVWKDFNCCKINRNWKKASYLLFLSKASHAKSSPPTRDCIDPGKEWPTGFLNILSIRRASTGDV